MPPRGVTTLMSRAALFIKGGLALLESDLVPIAVAGGVNEFSATRVAADRLSSAGHTLGYGIKKPAAKGGQALRR